MPTWCCLVCDDEAVGFDFDAMESRGWLSEWTHVDHVDGVCPRCHGRSGFGRGVTLSIESNVRAPLGRRPSADRARRRARRA